MDATPTIRSDARPSRDLRLVLGSLFGAALFFGGTALAEARVTPPVVLDSNTLNLGRIAPEGHAKGTVRLVNRSDRTLRIVRTITSCGCTSARFPRAVRWI